MAREIERDDLDVTPDHILVLKNAGPKGGPGMPEWGMLPIPQRLVKAGVRDMLRISDGRMSGTSYGACILHVAPESFVGGPLAFVETGDAIEVDVAARRIHLAVGEEELNRRRAHGRRRRHATRAATAPCSRSTSDRRTRAATSISSRGKGQIPEPEIQIPYNSAASGPRAATALSAPPCRARPHCRNGIDQFLRLEWLLQRGQVPPFFVQHRRAIARGENERDVACGEYLRDRIGLFAVEIDIDNGELELCFLGKLHGPVQPAGHRNDLMTQLGQRIFKEQGDEGFVLDHQHAAGRVARIHV